MTEPADSHGSGLMGGGQRRADVVPFRVKGSSDGYSSAGIGRLQGVESVPKRSDVTWLGQSKVPVTVLNELSRILEQHPELRAIRALDCEGSEMTLWTGNLPNGYGSPLIIR